MLIRNNSQAGFSLAESSCVDSGTEKAWQLLALLRLHILEAKAWFAGICIVIPFREPSIMLGTQESLKQSGHFLISLYLHLKWT